MAQIGDYQGLCAEYEEDIAGLKKEIERLKKENTLVNETIINLIKDNKQLEKEKEWLQYKVLEASQKRHTGKTYDEKIAMLEDDMQQALKEK